MNPENRRAKVSKIPPIVWHVLVGIGFWVLIILGACTVVGCAGVQRRDASVPPIPPQHPHPSDSILLGPMAPQASIVESAGDPSTVPAPGRSIRLYWNQVMWPAGYVVFESIDLFTWRAAVTNLGPQNTNCIIWCDKPAGFYKVCSLGQNGILSDPATK